MKTCNHLFLVCWIIHPALFSAVFLGFFWGCNNNVHTANPTGTQVDEAPGISAQFTEQVPAGKDATHLIHHFWDHINLEDASILYSPSENIEKRFVQYVGLLFHTPFAVADSSVQAFLTRTENNPAVHAYFLDAFEKYLYYSESPLRNDDLYVSVIDHIIRSEQTDFARKQRAAYNFKLLSTNKVGNQACDFNYVCADGKQRRLHEMEAGYLLVVFYNPGCSACKTLFSFLQQSPAIARMQKDKDLHIFTIYPDEEIQAWEEYKNKVPAEWVNGYDPSFRIKNEEVYDLRAIPTMYLLDRNKEVLLKDPAFEKLEAYLQTVMSK